MLCSPLNDHLFSYIHMIDDPSCACGHVRENNRHFLLDCPLFVNERGEMLDMLEILGFRASVKNLLYGSDEYSDQVNYEAFAVVHKFLEDTGRFTNV